VVVLIKLQNFGLNNKMLIEMECMGVVGLIHTQRMISSS